jgi:NDP-sugar pyrophosphorylase family protein
MIDLKLPIAKYEMHEYWLDIGSEDDYKKAQEAYKNNFTIDENNE